MPSPDGRVLEDDDVAALLAAEAGARHLHPLEDVLVADGRPDDLAAGRLDRGLEPAVREHGHDEAAVGEFAAGEPVQREDPEDLVAVDDPARSHRRRSAGRRRHRGRSPTSAPRVRTTSASEAGSVAPQPTLMLSPSGSSWITSTVAPVARRISGPHAAEPAPLAAVEHHVARRRVDGRASAVRWREVAVEQPGASTTPPELWAPTPAAPSARAAPAPRARPRPSSSSLRPSGRGP